MKPWWPSVSQSELGPPLRCHGSPTFLASQKSSYLMTSMARPAPKYATSGSPHAMFRATNLRVSSATQLCRVTSGFPTSSTCSVGDFIENTFYDQVETLHQLTFENGLLTCVDCGCIKIWNVKMTPFKSNKCKPAEKLEFYKWQPKWFHGFGNVSMMWT